MSQLEDAADRASRRATKIAFRIGGDNERPWPGEKPKGMHWSTYDRLLDAYIEAQEEAHTR